MYAAHYNGFVYADYVCVKFQVQYQAIHITVSQHTLRQYTVQRLFVIFYSYSLIYKVIIFVYTQTVHCKNQKYQHFHSYHTNNFAIPFRCMEVRVIFRKLLIIEIYMDNTIKVQGNYHNTQVECVCYHHQWLNVLFQNKKDCRTYQVFVLILIINAIRC